jgi:hypothetical protein
MLPKRSMPILSLSRKTSDPPWRGYDASSGKPRPNAPSGSVVEPGRRERTPRVAPHLAHEFVRSIVERRPPWINAITAANWTAAAICVHESAMAGGQVVIPEFV